MTERAVAGLEPRLLWASVLVGPRQGSGREPVGVTLGPARFPMQC